MGRKVRQHRFSGTNHGEARIERLLAHTIWRMIFSSSALRHRGFRLIIDHAGIPGNQRDFRCLPADSQLSLLASAQIVAVISRRERRRLQLNGAQELLQQLL